MQRKHVIAVLILVLLVIAGIAVSVFDGDTPSAPDRSGADATGSTPEGDADAAARDRKRIVNWKPEGEGSARGRVRAAGSEIPLAGAIVRLVAGRPGPDRMIETTTAKDGSFAFDAVLGFPAWELVVVAGEPFAELRRPDVEILSGRANDLGDVFVAPAYEVTGVVVDELGEPVKGATVTAQPWLTQEDRVNVLRLIREISVPSRALDRDTTDDQGRFALTKLSPAKYDLEASAPGYRLRIERNVIVNPDSAERPLRIVLQRGFRIEGQVHRADGGPLEGLPVIAFEQPNQDFAQMSIDRRFGVTDADGAFAVDGLGAGEYMVTVHPRGRPIGIANNVAVPTSQLVEITLGGDSWLEGRITAADGTAIAGADVYVVGIDRRRPRVGQARTDSRGDYRIDGLQSGDNGLFMVTADGYGAHPADFMQRIVSARSGLILKPGGNRHDAQLGRGGTLRGKVIDQDSEQPIEGVTIALKSVRSFFGGTPSSVSNEQGEFEITNIPLGSSVLFASKEGWLLPGLSPQTMINSVMQEMGGAATDTGRGNVVVVGEAGQVIERTVKLTPGAYLTGTVVAPDGTPVSGARVGLEFESNGGWLDQILPLFSLGDEVLSGDDGAFRIGAPPPAQAATLVVRAAGYLDGRSEALLLRPGENRDGLVVSLRQGAVLEGVVKNGKGEPLAGAQIRYAAMSGDNVPSWALRRATASITLEDGTYRIANVTTGRLAVQVTHEGHLSASRENVEVKEAGTERLDWKLESGAALSGRVLGSDGRPFAGATVSFALTTPAPQGADPHRVDPDDPISGADGTFRVVGLTPGTYSLTATAEGAAPSQTVTATAGDSAVTLRLAPAFDIAGLVKGPDGGPVPGIQVQIELNDGQNRNVVERTRTATDGTFRVTGVAEGTYDVTVNQGWRSGPDAPNVVPTTVKDVRAGTEGVLVQLTAGEVISGTVLSPDGEPITRGWAAAQRVQTPDDDRALSLGDLVLDGKFTLKGLLPGDYRITFFVDGGGNRAIVLAAGSRDVTVDFSKGGVVRGRVLLANGAAPPAGVTVYARGGSGETFDAPTAADGTYEIRGVAPGTYRVSAFVRVGTVGYAGTTEGVELVGEEVATADLLLAEQP